MSEEIKAIVRAGITSPSLMAAAGCIIMLLMGMFHAWSLFACKAKGNKRLRRHF